MGWPSYREDILERITDGLSSLIRDSEKKGHANSDAVEEARLEAIRRVQKQIGKVLDDYLEIATTPGLELAQKINELEAQITKLNAAVTSANEQTRQERDRTREITERMAQKDQEIAVLKKENDRLVMRVAYLNIKENVPRKSVRK